MKKWCRLEKIDAKAKQVAETFNFDPFKFIPNTAFLSNVEECPQEVEAGMYLVSGLYVESYTRRTYLTPEQLEDSILYLLGV